MPMIAYGYFRPFLTPTQHMRGEKHYVTSHLLFICLGRGRPLALPYTHGTRVPILLPDRFQGMSCARHFGEIGRSGAD
jgi:hypothetical protein